MPEPPFAITEKEEVPGLAQQAGSLIDDLYHERIGGAELGDVFDIGEDDVLALQVSETGGVQKSGNKVSIKNSPAGGLESDSNGEAVKCKPGGNLASDAAGLYTMTGGVTNHSALNELDYASAGHTGFSASGHNHDHGALAGKGDDDHPHYSLANGTRAFTGVVSGVIPTLAAHLATKQYVDDNDCPTYLYIKALAQAEGDLHLSDGTNWNVSKALIKMIRIVTASTDWDLYLLQNDNGHAADDANIPEMQIMDAGNGNSNIYLDFAYHDEDTSGEVHLYFIDNIAANTADIYVLGHGLK